MGYEIETLVHKNTLVPKAHTIKAIKSNRRVTICENLYILLIRNSVYVII